jgi:hypothetical protein
MELVMRNATSARLALRSALVAMMFALGHRASAADTRCDAQSQKGDLCLCEIADLHPTQTSVGMAEVRLKSEKLENKMEQRPEADFLNYLRKHEKVEPVTIGPGGVFYITDHHHLARALYDIGVAETYCTITDNLSNLKQDQFWKQMEDNNEVYLKDAAGNPIKPQDLPVAIKDLGDDPFRSLAGAVRESCGFEKGDPNATGEDYLEFKWADYLRGRWTQTGISPGAINADFNDATVAALRLAAEKDAAGLPGYTGKTSCD